MFFRVVRSGRETLPDSPFEISVIFPKGFGLHKGIGGGGIAAVCQSADYPYQINYVSLVIKGLFFFSVFSGAEILRRPWNSEDADAALVTEHVWALLHTSFIPQTRAVKGRSRPSHKYPARSVQKHPQKNRLIPEQKSRF